ncbi:hypothetical protein HDC90_001137 [Pedobacter sp. AK013]|uniref:hypothetical protein n=1 Tax=Pedobacter sp. AK013 TaxID=2723071 RepID=UPI00161F8547|nr:hypothetical protein [Pedobacter sp. AK013]MBB6236525.1 hypothetical protein [Pedobacter sp. AK013]
MRSPELIEILKVLNETTNEARMCEYTNMKLTSYRRIPTLTEDDQEALSSTRSMVLQELKNIVQGDAQKGIEAPFPEIPLDNPQ